MSNRNLFFNMIHGVYNSLRIACHIVYAYIYNLLVDLHQIRNRGQSEDPEDVGNNVRLRGKMPKEDYGKIQSNFTYLQRKITDPIGLCYKLFEKNVFDMDDKEQIQKVYNEGRKKTNDELLTILYDCNGSYSMFILCLQEVGCRDIIKKLEDTKIASGGSRRKSVQELELDINKIVEKAREKTKTRSKETQKGRMPAEDFNKIKNNFVYLLNNIRDPIDLSNKLFEKNVFDMNDKDTVSNTHKEGLNLTTDTLISRLANSGDSYAVFVECLAERGYLQIIDKLEGDSTKPVTLKPTLIDGDITEAEVDVIVNFMSKNTDPSTVSIFQHGGPSLLTEYKQKYSQGVQDGIIETGPGTLRCTTVYHILLEKLYYIAAFEGIKAIAAMTPMARMAAFEGIKAMREFEERLIKGIRRCLQKADDDGHTTIAFSVSDVPVNALEYSMYEPIKEYYSTEGRTIEINIYIDRDDDDHDEDNRKAKALFVKHFGRPLH